MATARQYLETAASYIGVSGTDNIFNTWIWGQHVYDPWTYPWCAAFQSYVGIHDLGMPFNASASAAGVAWQGERVDASEAQAGDWVLFNWDGRSDFGWADHIGVVEWFDHDSGYFGTIEGNTGGGEGSVMRCTRGLYNGYSTAFFRPPYDGEESEDNVTMGALDEAYTSPSGDETTGSVKERLAYTDMRVRELVEPHESAAGDGNKDGIRDQIDYIDKRVADIDKTVDEILKLLKAKK